MNSRQISSYILILLTLPFTLISAKPKEPVDYVDMFIGTSNSRWMLGPYAQEPFGMVQLGPDNQGNVWMGGYEYAINSVSGFSHLHAWTMGGLMIMPTTADLALTNPSADSPYKGANAGYHSRILKETEKASPGYYSVYLYDHEVKAELSATTRCGIHRYTFPERKESRILIDLLFPTEWDYGFNVKDACITKVSNTELEGYADCQSGPWSNWNNYKLHFIIRFSKPFAQLNGWNEGVEKDDIQSIAGKNDIGAYAIYSTTEGESITVSTGLSLVSIEQARLNMDTELAPLQYDFDRVVAQTRNKWNELLGRIEIEGTNEVDKTKFYTNLYRAYASAGMVDTCFRDVFQHGFIDCFTVFAYAFLIGGNHQGCFVRTFHDAGVFQSGRPFACPSGMFEHLQLGGYPIVHDAGGDDRPEAV